MTGVPGLTPRIASAAMAMVAVATEAQVSTVAFTSGRTNGWRSGHARRTSWRDSGELSPVPLSARQRLDDVVRGISGLSFGGTDCSLPMRYALDKGLAVDSFVVYTDSETWHGDIHPVQALRTYRDRTGIPARLTVQLIADFAAGRI